MANQMQYALYKGLQRPLVFKMFKGKYIYWAMGSIIAGVIIGGVISALVSSLVGIICFTAITVSLTFFTISKQKKGLHAKKREKAMYIIQPKQRLSKNSLI
jgi:large-conductance mechanosensitive channel